MLTEQEMLLMSYKGSDFSLAFHRVLRGIFSWYVYSVDKSLCVFTCSKELLKYNQWNDAEIMER